MNKVLILLIFLLLNIIHSSLITYGQDFESKLFNSFCKEIVNKDELFKLCQEFEEIKLVVDLETSEHSVYIPDSVSNEKNKSLMNLILKNKRKYYLQTNYLFSPYKIHCI